jgi:hypothetical protein
MFALGVDIIETCTALLVAEPGDFNFDFVQDISEFLIYIANFVPENYSEQNADAFIKCVMKDIYGV